jgi:hypothetical protein
VLGSRPHEQHFVVTEDSGSSKNIVGPKRCDLHLSPGQRTHTGLLSPRSFLTSLSLGGEQREIAAQALIASLYSLWSTEQQRAATQEALQVARTGLKTSEEALQVARTGLKSSEEQRRFAAHLAVSNVKILCAQTTEAHTYGEPDLDHADNGGGNPLLHGV